MAETRKRRRLSKDEDSESKANDLQATEKNEVTELNESKEEPTQPSSQKPARKTLFVRSLPASATTESLTEYFSQSYPIRHATAVSDPETKQCKGYGFVTFADVEDAQRALEELNNSVFEGRKIKIEIAEPRHREIDKTIGKSVPSAEAAKLKEGREKRKQENKPPKLIIRNLPWSVTEPEQLALLFRSYGKVKHADIPKRGARHSGFGFVVMRGKKNAEKAIQGVNGKEVDGRTLAVDWAVDKAVWEDLQRATDGFEEIKDAPKEGDSGESGSDVDAEMIDYDVNGSEDGINEDDEDEDEDEDGVEVGEGEEDEEEDGVEDRDDERNASTIFIRNLPFSATDETLHDHFSQFGAVRYARVVVDPGTDRPRGTAFVCFWNKEDAHACIREAPKDVIQGPPKEKSAIAIKKSVLENEQNDPSGKYTMDGRVLQISQAVTRKEAGRLEEEGSSRREARDTDKRRLYLLSEGTIATNSPLYSKLSPSEIKMREASLKQRQKLIKTNPMLHISLTRLSVRNIPRHIDSKALKQLAREAVVGFATDVKQGRREPLSKEELSRSADIMKEQEKLRKSQGKGIVKQAKVIFEGREGSKISETSGAGRSRGYGFIEYTTHRSALMGLRWLNGHAVVASGPSKVDPEEKRKRLIVEFAIENAQVVKRRQEAEVKSREIKLQDKLASGSTSNLGGFKRDGWKNKPRNTQESGSTPNSGGFKRDGWKNKPSNKQGSGPASQSGGADRGLKRKRNDKTAEMTNGKKPKLSTPVSSGAGKSEDQNHIAKRNRIIAKKRMMRRTRKG